MSYFEKLLLSLIAGVLLGFAIDVLAADTRTISLSWDHATKREDDSALPLEEIDGYKIYYSVDNGAESSISVPRTTSYELENPVSGEYQFQISTVSLGLEGRRSDPVDVSVPKSSARSPYFRVQIRLCNSVGDCISQEVAR